MPATRQQESINTETSEQGATIPQTWDGAANPTNMKTYHSWIDPCDLHRGGRRRHEVYNARYGAYSRNSSRGQLPASGRHPGVERLYTQYEWHFAGHRRVTRFARSTPRVLRTRPARSDACGVTRPFTPRWSSTFSVPSPLGAPDTPDEDDPFRHLRPGGPFGQEQPDPGHPPPRPGPSRPRVCTFSRSRSMTLARSGATSNRTPCAPLPTPSPITLPCGSVDPTRHLRIERSAA